MGINGFIIIERRLTSLLDSHLLRVAANPNTVGQDLLSLKRRVPESRKLHPNIGVKYPPGSKLAMKKIAILLTGGVLGLGLLVGSAAAQDSASQDMKDAGHATKNAAKDVGHGTATAAKKTGSATKKTTKKVVHKGAQKTDEGATKVEGKTEPK
jgi:hypothetical protein